MKLDPKKPIYRQLVLHFQERIASGALSPGESLPSRRELAKELKINPNTVQRAYKELEDQGLVVTQANVNSVITQDPVIISQLKEQLVLDNLDAFYTRIQSLNISAEEAINLLRSYLKKKEVGEDHARD